MCELNKMISPHQHLIVTLFYFSQKTSLRCSAYIIVILIHCMLITSDADHLFMFLIASYMSSLVKCPFKYFTHFELACFLIIEFLKISFIEI